MIFSIDNGAGSGTGNPYHYFAFFVKIIFQFSVPVGDETQE